MDRVRRSWGATVALLVAASAASIGVAPFLHSELIPQFREGHFVIQMTAAAQGRPLPTWSQRAFASERAPETALHSRRRPPDRPAEAGEDTWSPDKSEFHVEPRERARGDRDRGPGQDPGGSRGTSRRCGRRQ